METTRDSIDSFYSCADMRSRNKGVVINLRFFLELKGISAHTLAVTQRMFELLSIPSQLASVAYFLYTFWKGHFSSYNILFTPFSQRPNSNKDASERKCVQNTMRVFFLLTRRGKRYDTICDTRKSNSVYVFKRLIN